MSMINNLPTYDENTVLIAVSVNNKFIPYLGVYLQSIVEYATPKHKYNIIVMEDDVDENSKERLQKIICNHPHITLFYVTPKFDKTYTFTYREQYPDLVYYKLLLPSLLRDHKKVLFTDIDTVFQRDPAELFFTDLEGYALGACQDFVLGAYINKYPSWFEYTKTVLQLENMYKYFNVGVLLIDIPQWLQKNIGADIINDVSSTKYIVIEQDATNKYFKENIKYLDTKWNIHIIAPSLQYLMEFMPEEFIPILEKNLKNPGIFHWAAHEKPWNTPHTDKADEWWALARKTPFYEQIIYINTQNRHRSNNLKQTLKKILKKFIKSPKLRRILKKCYHTTKILLIKIRKK